MYASDEFSTLFPKLAAETNCPLNNRGATEPPTPTDEHTTADAAQKRRQRKPPRQSNSASYVPWPMHHSFLNVRM
jgi:hypothetical protein